MEECPCLFGICTCVFRVTASFSLSSSWFDIASKKNSFPDAMNTRRLFLFAAYSSLCDKAEEQTNIPMCLFYT
jgi:hypothetical protein